MGFNSEFKGLIGNNPSVRDFCMLNLFQVVQGLRMSWRWAVKVKEIHLFLFGELWECRVNGRATGKIVFLFFFFRRSNFIF